VSVVQQWRRSLQRFYVRHAPMTVGKAAAAQQLLSAFRAKPQTRLARTVPGPRLAVETDDLLQAYLYLFGVWEPNLTAWVRRALRPGDTFIDVGANIGYFTVLAARLVGGRGHVVAVEASPQFTAAARANVALNRCGNVRVVNVAAGEGPGRLAFFQPCRTNRGNTTSVNVDALSPPLFTVASQALPDILTGDELTRARLVKIDVEGAEYAVVQGLVPVLSRMRDDVELIVEINPALLAAQDTSAARLVDLLGKYGFHAYRIANGYCIPDYVPRRRPCPPVRWSGPVTELSDFVFSRHDVPSL
jgi:FkbM family methyltransferase